MPEETEACSALLLYGPDRAHRPRWSYRSHGSDGKHGSNWPRGSDGKHGSDRPRRGYRSHGSDGKHGSDRSRRGYGARGSDGKHGSDRPRRGYRSCGSDGKHGSNWLYGSHRRNRPGRIGSGCGISYRVFSAGSSGNVRDSAGF